MGRVLHGPRPPTCLYRMPEIVIVQDCWTKVDPVVWTGSMRNGYIYTSVMGTYRTRDCFPRSRCLHSKGPCFHRKRLCFTNPNQIVPDVEAVEAVEANPHTIRGRTQPQPSAMRPEESLDMPPSRIC